MDVPVLFIFFRRPEIAYQSFCKIRSIRPRKLYLACDGARKEISGEEELVKQTRDLILNAIDWECDVKVNFQEENLGCSMGVYTAINWLFHNEDYGIILEDDCVVQDSFFPFMEELLIRFKDDERIGMVDGANYIKQISIPDSYCFSKYKSTNGWGTWRRAWKNMDLTMSWRGGKYSYSILANMGYCSKDIKYWKYRLKAIDSKYVSAWDWQWYFTLSAFNQLSIFPKYGLVTNIGFGEGATHTTEAKVPECYMTSDELDFPLIHPTYIVPYEPFEKAFYNQNNTIFYNLMKYIPFSLKKFVKKNIRKF